MSVMCKMNESCIAKKGMCIHEKMMAAVIMVGLIAGSGHWLLHWF